MTAKNFAWQWARLLTIISLFAFCSCGGTGKKSSSSTDPQNSAAICQCVPSEPDAVDFRHDAKHVALPSGVTPQEITVNDVVSWGWGNDPASDAPRFGREPQLMHIAQAFVQFVWLVPNDCDIHMEISGTPDKNAPRAIVETPVDSTFCPTREAEVSGLARFGVPLNNAGFETAQGIAVDVLGLPFRDFNHPRGTGHVTTVWEIHPAIVNVH